MAQPAWPSALPVSQLLSCCSRLGFVEWSLAIAELLPPEYTPAISILRQALTPYRSMPQPPKRLFLKARAEAQMRPVAILSGAAHRPYSGYPAPARPESVSAG